MEVTAVRMTRQRVMTRRDESAPRQRVVFLRHRIFALLRRPQLNFVSTMPPKLNCISVSSMPLPNVKYLGRHQTAAAYLKSVLFWPSALPVQWWHVPNQCKLHEAAAALGTVGCQIRLAPSLIPASQMLATMVPVGRRSGAGTSTIRSRARHASLGRCVTITRY
jgi:hypothetical protein